MSEIVLLQNVARDLNMYWKKTQNYEPGVTRNVKYFCEKNDRQKIVSIRVGCSEQMKLFWGSKAVIHNFVSGSEYRH